MAPRTRRSSAGDLQANLGSVVARVNAVKQQRAAVVRELHHVITSAEQMLADLGEARPRGGRGRVGATGGAPKKRRRLSAEGRANIIAAAKKRWAKYNKEKKKAS